MSSLHTQIGFFYFFYIAFLIYCFFKYNKFINEIRLKTNYNNSQFKNVLYKFINFILGFLITYIILAFPVSIFIAISKCSEY